MSDIKRSHGAKKKEKSSKPQAPSLTPELGYNRINLERGITWKQERKHKQNN